MCSECLVILAFLAAMLVGLWLGTSGRNLRFLQRSSLNE